MHTRTLQRIPHFAATILFTVLLSMAMASCTPSLPAAGEQAPAAAALETIVGSDASADSSAVPPDTLTFTTTITIADGTLVGNIVDGVAAFKSIPYAAPPVDDLRWRAPQPVVPWEGQRDATEFIADCMQAPSTEAIQTTPSEDCLFVNVWMPEGAQPGDNLPVFVWIHGGGFAGGGTSIPWFDGSRFAQQDIVMVSLNYRLGRFGFFAHPAVIDEAEQVGENVGNYGLQDQLRALQWVQENVANFGGDPNRVTLAGESAGGQSVMHWITSPLSEGLFQQAMVLSGGGRTSLIFRSMDQGTPSKPPAPGIDYLWAEGVGIQGDDSAALEKLRTLDPVTIAGDVNLESLAGLVLKGDSLPGAPVIDDYTVVGQPGQLLANGVAHFVPLLIGSTTVDVPTAFPPSKLFPFAWFGPDEAAAREAYGGERIMDLPLLARVLLSMGSDMTMHEPAHMVAAQMDANGQPAWVYRFTYTAESTRPESMGQVHAGELPWLFDQVAAAYGDDTTPNDQAMADAFHGYFVNFIKTGDPNGSDINGGNLPEWPQIDPGVYDVLDFTLDDGPVFGADPRPTVELVGNAQARRGE